MWLSLSSALVSGHQQEPLYTHILANYWFNYLTVSLTIKSKWVLFYKHLEFFVRVLLQIVDILVGKKAEVQQAETHPLYLCQFVLYGCVFVNIFILTDKNTSAFSYVLIKVQSHSDIFTPTYLYALTIVHPQFYVHRQIYTLNLFCCIFVFLFCSL